MAARVSADMVANQTAMMTARCRAELSDLSVHLGACEHPLMVVMEVIVRHQDRGALRLDHLHNRLICTLRHSAQRGAGRAGRPVRQACARVAIARYRAARDRVRLVMRRQTVRQSSIKVVMRA
jgi:hypothetical protein